MPVLAAEALSRAVERGEKGGVFFLFGDEEYLKEEAASALVSAHLDPATRDFNLDQLRGDSVEPETLASVLATPPMMAEWRVVLVRDAQGLAASARLREIVESVLAAPPAGLALILVAQLPPRSRARFYSTLRDGARSAEFAPLSVADLPGWLMARASVDGVELEPDAARALAAAVGSDLGTLGGELAKLRDFVGERRRVTLADIETAVGPVARQNRWEWFDIVGAGRLDEARRSLRTLLDAGESGVGLVIGLGSHFLRLALAATGGERGLADELPPHQKWLARRIAAQARSWPAFQLAGALDDLLRADRLLKSSSLNDEQIMEDTLLRMSARRA